MTEQQFPPRWDAERTKRLIADFEAQSEDEIAAADDAAAQHDGLTAITVPDTLLPKIRELLATHKTN